MLAAAPSVLRVPSHTAGCAELSCPLGDQTVIILLNTTGCVCILQETAINIGYACSLITDEMTQFQLSGSCAEVDLLEADGRVSCALYEQMQTALLWSVGPMCLYHEYMQIL